MNPSQDDKPRWPFAAAMEVAESLVELLQPICERIEIAGSLRRRKAMVGDVEILYISESESRPDGLFDRIDVNLADEALLALIDAGVIDYRLNVKGSRMWGDANKFAVHRETGIPVDFFRTSEAAWHNYLVCRTGPGASNIRIAEAAAKRGLKWHPYGVGFTKGRETLVIRSERQVFETVGLPYLEPEARR